MFRICSFIKYKTIKKLKFYVYILSKSLVFTCTLLYPVNVVKKLGFFVFNTSFCKFSQNLV